ncbi:MAG: GNAT family N-acetyltransferase, partial [Burkholderiales bacterium]
MPFEKVSHLDWNTLSDSSPQAWIFHRAEWIAIEARHFFPENLSFALEDRHGLAGIFPFYATDNSTGTWYERLLHSGFHRHTGLALSARLSASDAKAARSAAMNHIFGLAERQNADRIQINAHNLAPENLSIARKEIPFWVEDHAFSLGMAFGPSGLVAAPGVVTCCADQIVELAADEADLFKHLDDKENVRKAERENVVITVGEHFNAVNDFYIVAQKCASRTGELIMPVDYYNDIWRAFYDHGRCSIIFACHNNVPVGAVLLLIYKKSATYLAGFSDPSSLHLRANDFLLWSAILWAKRGGL